MYKKFGISLFITTAIFIFINFQIFSADLPVERERITSRAANKSVTYSSAEEQSYNTSRGSNHTPLGTSKYEKDPGHPSPGIQVGNTWYDLQHFGSMGRMIDWGPHSGETGNSLSHFSYMYLPNPVFVNRKYSYNYYDANNGTFGINVGIQPDDEYAGFVGLDVTPDGRAVVGGHNNQGSGFQPQIYFDFAPGMEFFGQTTRVPDSTAEYGQLPGTAMMWPKFRYQYGTDTVLHVIAQASLGSEAYDTTSGHAITYFRKVGLDNSGQWDYPPYVIDTIFNPSHDISASRISDKIAIVWTANLPNPGDCDTCSGESNNSLQYDNDIYYQVSNNQGITWQPRVNVTQNIDGEAGFRSYTDLSALIDGGDNLHILYSAVNWPANPGYEYWGTNCRLFHWSENNPYIRTVAVADWQQQPQCKPGKWNINISKMSISDCDNKLYAVWVQYNNPVMGVVDDCSLNGFANGDLYVSISDDGGLTWDVVRNLTHSYSGGCDPANGGEPCYNDNWPSMARYGRQNLGGEDWSGAEVVVPGDVSWVGDYYLDVQYIDDKDAGAIVLDEGTWQLAEVNWFRMACVDPLPSPCFYPSFTSIEYPAWGQSSTQVDTALTLESPCNVTLNYSITIEEDNGPQGWLAISGFSGTIPAGVGSEETGTIHLNYGGMVSAPIQLIGRLIFNSNAPSTPDTFSIEFLVVDTLFSPSFDTISTNCLSLIVNNSGNFGNQGAGQVNMDWVNADDCDSTADVYLYDGSPVIGWIDGADTIMNWSIYGASYLDPNGFVPVEPGGGSWSPDSAMNVFETAVFTTHDSSIAMQKTWYTPQDFDSCDFIIQALKIWSYDGLSHNGLVIGEAIDWDIPSDSGVDNNGGFDPVRNLVYLQGVEYNQDDTIECQDNDTRFGGIAFLESYLNDTLHQTIPYGGLVADNKTYVYPNGGFVPAELYENMLIGGLWLGDSTNQDLHTVMCYEPNFALGAVDTFVVYTVLSTVMNGTETGLQANIDKAQAWYYNHIPPDTGFICGDVDGDGWVDIADLVYLANFLFTDGSPPTVMEAADVNGVPGVNVGDLIYLVESLFGVPAPELCPGPKRKMPVSEGVITLDHVDGLYNSTNLIKAGEPVTFYIRLNNDVPGRSIPIPGLTNGFRIYSSSGAEWGSLIADTTDIFDSSPLDGGFFVKSYSADGAGADTVGFGGFAMFDDGLPAGYNEVSYQITIGPIDSMYEGDTICIDSSWYPPVNDWIWSDVYDQYYSSWNGPHCFTVVNVRDLKPEFSATPTAGAVSFTAQFTDESSGSPVSWNWNFGDGGTSMLPNPSHQYDSVGRFDVTLIVTDAGGYSDTLVKLGYINVSAGEYADLSAQMSINPWGNRPGFELWYWCYWNNLGTGAAENCNLWIELPSEMQFQELRDSSGVVIPSENYTLSNDTISMPLGTVLPSNNRNHVTPFGTLSQGATIGDTLRAKMWLTSTSLETSYINNQATHLIEISSSKKRAGSQSRNGDTYGNKIAYPNGTNLTYPVVVGLPLEYRIDFENLSSATSNIYSLEVKDTLDFDLNWQEWSLQIGEMSHPDNCVFLNFDPESGELTWWCDNIDLPPNVNPPEGEGYFTYSVFPWSNLEDGTVIENTAQIKFRYDPWLGAGPLIRIIGDCCVGIRGNIDGLGEIPPDEHGITIADLVYFVAYSFDQPPGPPPPCTKEADVDDDNEITIADIVYMVDFMFSQPPGPDPVDCSPSK